ncbi:hypothetical protein BDF14DRAFT_1866491 [Spinellus fusiger]|nr:hypothetical protein BDF14DRAFT_1866491 [Spinellus fusiger]
MYLCFSVTVCLCVFVPVFMCLYTFSFYCFIIFQGAYQHYVYLHVHIPEHRWPLMCLVYLSLYQWLYIIC